MPLVHIPDELEDVRELNYRSLQNIILLVYAVASFVAVVLDAASKLKVMAGYVLKATKSAFWRSGVSLLPHC